MKIKNIFTSAATIMAVAAISTCSYADTETEDAAAIEATETGTEAETSTAYLEIAENTTLWEYAESLYDSSLYSEDEEEIFEIIRRVETQDNSDIHLNSKSKSTTFVAYFSVSDEVINLYKLLCYEYGFGEWAPIMGVMKEDTYRSLKIGIEDFDAFKENFIRTAETAKELAASLKGETDWETVNNIYNYIEANAVPDASDKLITGFYDGEGIVCSGYSSTFAQLCRLNGISCNVVCGYHEGTAHSWNEVTVDGNTYFADIALNAGILDSLPEGYVIDIYAGQTSVS